MPVNLIPIMTSDTTPAPYVAAADSVISNYYAYKAFDGNVNTQWGTGHVMPPAAWLSFDFGSALYAVTSYSITTNLGSDGSPRSWTFECSDDGANWAIIDTQVDVGSPNWGYGVTKTFNTLVGSVHRYYRLNISAGWNGTNISELQMFTGPLPVIINGSGNLPLVGLSNQELTGFVYNGSSSLLLPSLSGGTNDLQEILPLLTTNGSGTNDFEQILPSFAIKSADWMEGLKFPLLTAFGIINETYAVVRENLPKFSINAATEPVMDVATTLPLFMASGTTPISVLASTQESLPKFVVSGTLLSAAVGRVDLTLPLMSESATHNEIAVYKGDIILPLMLGYAELGNKSDITIPTLTINAELKSGEFGNALETIPMFNLAGFMASGAVSSSDINIRLYPYNVGSFITGEVGNVAVSMGLLNYSLFANTGSYITISGSIPLMQSNVGIRESVKADGSMSMPRLVI